MPHVHGKSSECMYELIDVWEGEEVYGKEKFWIRRKTEGLWGLGMRESGDV